MNTNKKGIKFMSFKEHFNTDFGTDKGHKLPFDMVFAGAWIGIGLGILLHVTGITGVQHKHITEVLIVIGALTGLYYSLRK